MKLGVAGGMMIDKDSRSGPQQEARRRLTQAHSAHRRECFPYVLRSLFNVAGLRAVVLRGHQLQISTLKIEVLYCKYTL